MRTDHLLFGAAYYLEYLPYDRLETDMEMMERAGMNTIRIAESTWSTLEPSDGVFDFTCIDRMVQAAAKHHFPSSSEPRLTRYQPGWRANTRIFSPSQQTGRSSTVTVRTWTSRTPATVITPSASSAP